MTLRLRPRRIEWIALGLVIAAVAVALRFWRLTWGLSEQLGFPDELVNFNRYAEAFKTLSCSSFAQRNPQYPTLYGYLLALTATALDATGLFPQPLRQASLQAFLGGRLVAAVAGIATVGLVGVTATRMYSRHAGFAAAALMAVLPFHVLYGHVGSTDVLLAAFAALTVHCADGATRTGRSLLAAAAGFAAGLAFSTKYTGLAMLVPAGWVVLDRGFAERSVRRAALLALAVGAGFLGGVLCGCPPCVLTPDIMLRGMRALYVQTTYLYSGLHNNYLVPSLGWYGRQYVYQLVASLPFALGWPLYALSLAGVAVALRGHGRGDRLLLVTLVSFFVAMSSSQVAFPRYLMPLFPVLVILAGRAATALERPRWAGLAVLAGVWIYTLALSVSQIARFSFDQQREVAEWIARSPARTAESRVGVPQVILDYYRLEKPLGERGLRMVSLQRGKWFEDPPEFLVLPEWVEISIDRDQPGGSIWNDLERLRSGAAGYTRAASWRSTYLQESFYTRLDPAFAADLWQGEIGFTVYVRDRAALNRTEPAETGSPPARR